MDFFYSYTHYLLNIFHSCMSLSLDHLFHRMEVRCASSEVTLKCPSWRLWVGVQRDATRLKSLEHTETALKGQSANLELWDLGQVMSEVNAKFPHLQNRVNAP